MRAAAPAGEKKKVKGARPAMEYSRQPPETKTSDSKRGGDNPVVGGISPTKCINTNGR